MLFTYFVCTYLWEDSYGALGTETRLSDLAMSSCITEPSHPALVFSFRILAFKCSSCKENATKL